VQPLKLRSSTDTEGPLTEPESSFAKRPIPQLHPLLLSAADLAQLLRVSVPTIWRLRAAGKLPRPLDTLGKQLGRWNTDEIRRWVTAGMPNLKTWEAMNRL
jgi:predicted DNA-binding transcriptional regulator AlpA